MGLLREVEAVNDFQKLWVLKKLHDLVGSLSGKSIALWGGAFKPDTDDIREATSLTVLDGLIGEGARVSLHDPAAMPALREIYGDSVCFGENPYSVLAGADVLVLLTEWRVFRNPDWRKVKSLMSGTLVLDGRNQYEPSELSRHGLSWHGVGRGCFTGNP